MKRIITLMGVLGVFSAFTACSSDTPSAALEVNEFPTSVSSTAVPETTYVDPGDSTVFRDSVINNDTTIHKPVYISASSNVYDKPYMSSGEVFCWTEGCEANYPRSSSSTEQAPQSSSDVGGGAITIEVQKEDPAKVEGNKMTDVRDNKTYTVETVAGRLWMSENIKRESPTGSYCTTNGDDKDVCDLYGTFYTYAAASSYACPGGWRLPTVDEVQAAAAAKDTTWWTVGGRFKIEGDNASYGLEKEQGYIWVESNGEFNSWRIEDYTDKHTLQLQSGSASERAYNVRCIQKKEGEE